MEALSHFGVESKIVGSVSGPHVTRYELRLAPGIKMSKVSNMRDDLAYALAADDVRILAPIPGKRAVGVEVPNRVRNMVHLGDVAQESPEGWSPLTVWLGKDIDGRAIGIDLASQPHVLVAGTTGSGKSGCVNAMLASILMRATPNEVRLVLVDPKQVELNLYEHVPHLLTPVITSPRLAANALQNLIKEMEERYSLMSGARTRKLEELNRLRVRNGERPLPYILCVIDELADLMMVAPGEVEDSIIRLAQKSRAVGIHLVLATQRPSVDIITGMIKTNVPARIAFAVSSQTDSRVILDQNGAESLLGKGDMLFRPGSGTKLSRIQGAFTTEEEIEKITGHWRKQGEPELHEELLEAVEPEEPEEEPSDFNPDADDLLADAIRTVVQMDTASTSMLQRRLRVGYTRAGRLIDMLERRGRDLRLRGLEGPQGADLRGRPAARAGRARGTCRRRRQPTKGPDRYYARIGTARMPPIGDTLREARMRQQLDIVDVEQRTKIRAKYLRALENEEWALLPGPTFVRTFLRTYAEAVGLDPHVLVEAYRTQHDDSEEQPEAQQPMAATPRRRPPARPSARRSGAARRGPPARPGRSPCSGGAVVLVIVGLLVLGLLGGDDDKDPGSQRPSRPPPRPQDHAAPARPQAPGAQAGARAG